MTPCTYTDIYMYIGVLYGRYQNDNYAGGNPWVLTTAALGNLFYRGGNYIKEHGLPDADAMVIWEDVFGISETTSTKDNKKRGIKTDDDSTGSSVTADTFVAAGDAVMNRLRYHVIVDKYHLSEQIDRNTGVQISAEDLTWSYAEVLNAMSSRDKYFATTA